MIANSTLQEMLLHQTHQQLSRATEHDWREVPIQECHESFSLVPDDFCYGNHDASGKKEDIVVRSSVWTMFQNASLYLNEKSNYRLHLRIEQGWIPLETYEEQFWFTMANFTVPSKVSRDHWSKLMEMSANPKVAFLKLPPQIQNYLLRRHRKHFVETDMDNEAIAKSPPPHTTGGAIDVVVCNAAGYRTYMGFSSYFCERGDTFYEYLPTRLTGVLRKEMANRRRMFINTMVEAGFVPHPRKIWHFESPGTQWGALVTSVNKHKNLPAVYGMVKEVKKEELLLDE